MEKVCLVIVTYNRYDVLSGTIDRINNQIRLPDYFIIVDNFSDDGSYIRLISSGNNFEVVQMTSNLGYGAGLAMGMKYALKKYDDIDYFWLMDDDSHPHEDTLSLLVEAHKESGMKGVLSVTGFIDHFWSGPIRFSNYRDKQSRSIHSGLSLYEVDHVLVDGALVDREVVDKVGTPYELFFMMCEDVEYSKRIKRAGYKAMVLENEDLMQRLHFGGGEKFSRSTLWRGYYHSRNHLIILKKYFSWINLLSYIIRQIKYLIGSLMAKDRSKRIGLRLLGIFHGIIGREGKTLDPRKV